MSASTEWSIYSHCLATSFVLRCLAGCTLALLLLSGCASSDSGAPDINGSVYYGVGFHDPWYHGATYYASDIIVTPPVRPLDPPHVEHPIATPPSKPLPSIPSTPRPVFRR
jgi:hypothetical protein